MNKIDGRARSIRELLKGAKFAVDYYQREYSWQTKQVSELIDDLSGKFLESYRAEHDRRKVEDYGHYFLGSIIVSEKEGQRFIVDGQQRLTTLTLLLLYLRRAQSGRDGATNIDELIFSEKYGVKSFNLNIPERNSCMAALFGGEILDGSKQTDSITNILGRFEDIGTTFPPELLHEALLHFVDWLIENVHLVEITAYSDTEAYTIFETMNDRGLSLTPTAMLKGYLLANIQSTEKRTQANTVWKEQISRLQGFGKEEDADCIKAWLRGQHAGSIRERKVDAKPQDFEKIGTEFHRWIKDNNEALVLRTSDDFVRFIERDFHFYTGVYARMRQAALSYSPNLGSIFFNALGNFTLQYPMMLAAVDSSDSESTVVQKLSVVSRYAEIFLARRMWNYKSTDYNTVQYNSFLTMKAIRRLNLNDLAEKLVELLGQDGIGFDTRQDFALTGSNRKYIQRMLARMTDYVEVNSGLPSMFQAYVDRSGKNGFEVEHIWADIYEYHKQEFGHQTEFEAYRDRIGDLLLLQKSFNASYGAKPYAEKKDFYLQQNLLAKSLRPDAYQNNPGFVRFVESSGLPFEPIENFDRQALDKRQGLYVSLAEMVWSPNSIRALAQR